jgi:hypothetical protein
MQMDYSDECALMILRMIKTSLTILRGPYLPTDNQIE